MPQKNEGQDSLTRIELSKRRLGFFILALLHFVIREILIERIHFKGKIKIAVREQPISFWL